MSSSAGGALVLFEHGTKSMRGKQKQITDGQISEHATHFVAETDDRFGRVMAGMLLIMHGPRSQRIQTRCDLRHGSRGPMR